jgi:hypothetical protein
MNILANLAVYSHKYPPYCVAAAIVCQALAKLVFSKHGQISVVSQSINGLKSILFHCEGKYLLAFKKTGEFIAYYAFTYACWCASKNKDRYIE